MWDALRVSVFNSEALSSYLWQLSDQTHLYLMDRRQLAISPLGTIAIVFTKVCFRKFSKLTLLSK